VSLIVRALGIDDLDDFVDHLGAHFAENGRDGTPVFTPTPNSEPFDADARRARLSDELCADVGSEDWTRVWAAFVDDALIGHVDLQARHEPSTSHRALLGLGVLAPFRGRGMGAALLEAALMWARAQPLAWIDLYVFASNTGAQRLYTRFGFRELARVPDLFRVDGQSIDDIAMTLRL
jgi:ribosomal protein S18 acetylase RimI-like enzyme